FHPGGSLGEQLTTVGDKMHRGREIPLADPRTPMATVLDIMTERRFGCVGVVSDATDEGQILLGIITDGDLRRSLIMENNTGHTITSKCAEDLMKRNPVTVTPDVLMADALAILQEKSITSLFIVDTFNKPIGLIHIHDFLKSGVI
ncbi:MAG: CBS domain-containing protein, partial [Alphaproteobacteria bacterium]|nr:CBS domain-containing protein [Alphaproteobacteria bacterium]